MGQRQHTQRQVCGRRTVYWCDKDEKPVTHRKVRRLTRSAIRRGEDF